MGRRTLLLISSILIAAIGTALVGLYVRSADTRARGDMELVEALIAQKEIPEGISAAQLRTDYLSFEPIPRANVPKNAIATYDDLAEIKGQTNVAIHEGEFAMKQDFTGTEATTNVVPAGTNAVPVTVENAARIPALLKPGDVVNVWKVMENGTAQLLLTNVKILTIGNVVQGQPNPEVVERNVINLALKDPAEIQKILSAQATGELSFVLPGTSAAPSNIAPASTPAE